MVLDVKKSSRKSCVSNLFVGSNLTFDTPFKVKLVLATFNPFLYFHLFSEAQYTMSPDTFSAFCDSVVSFSCQNFTTLSILLTGFPPSFQTPRYINWVLAT